LFFFKGLKYVETGLSSIQNHPNYDAIIEDVVNNEVDTELMAQAKGRAR